MSVNTKTLMSLVYSSRKTLDLMIIQTFRQTFRNKPKSETASFDSLGESVIVNSTEGFHERNLILWFGSIGERTLEGGYTKDDHLSVWLPFDSSDNQDFNTDGTTIKVIITFTG